jgi:catechol 2,3-dioxygenase-like lactoylglutathione lyase family enzyme
LKLAIPVLRVSRSEAAEAFYCERLGFRRLFAYRPDPSKPDPCYMGLARDEARLHVSSFPGDGVSGGVAYLTVDDVDALHAELAGKDVRIDLEPTDQTWGNREMYVRDGDGNCLRFSQERQPSAGSPSGVTPDYDTDKVDAVVLALLYLTLHDVNEYGGRAWKGHDWDAMDRLYDKGLISDPRSKAKSVSLDAAGIKAAQEAFRRLFGKGR